MQCSKDALADSGRGYAAIAKKSAHRTIALRHFRKGRWRSRKTIGQLATTIGYEPLFACLTVFDLTAFAIIALVLGQRGGQHGGKSSAAMPNATAGAD